MYIAVDCQGLAAIKNGAIYYNTGKTTYSTIAQYTCNTGYNLIGSESRICQSDGTWNSTDPSCIGNHNTQRYPEYQLVLINKLPLKL